MRLIEDVGMNPIREHIDAATIAAAVNVKNQMMMSGLRW
jgi:hypothetical protein